MLKSYEVKHAISLKLVTCLALLCVLMSMALRPVHAADLQLQVTQDPDAAVVNYSISGIETTTAVDETTGEEQMMVPEMSVTVADEAGETVYTAPIPAENLSEGTVTGSFTLADLGNVCGLYTVSFQVGSDTLTWDETVDFSVGCESFEIIQNDERKGFDAVISDISAPGGVSSVRYYIYDKDGNQVYTHKAAQEENTYTATILMSKLYNYKLGVYTVKAVVTLNNGSKAEFTTTADESLKKGTMKGYTTSTEKTMIGYVKNAYVPGNFKSVKFLIYKKSAGEKTAITVSGTYSASTKKWTAKKTVSKISGVTSGKWVIKAVGTTRWGTEYELGSKTVTLTKATTKGRGTSPSSKRGTFYLKTGSIVAPSGIKSVTFIVKCKNSKDSYTYKATKTSNGIYKVKVNIANHKYHMGDFSYSVKVVMNNGITSTAATGKYHFAPTNFMRITSTSTSDHKRTLYLYNPSRSGTITFSVWSKTNGTDDLTTYTAKKSGDHYYAVISMANLKHSGRIYVNTKIGGVLVDNHSFSFKIAKSELVKNGWYYEKYNGTTYKFYYSNGKKVTDLTKILNIKESTSTNVNKFTIVLNRAACTATVYAYDSQTKSYCIPVKAFRVSVGRDTTSTGSVSATNTNTSFTPLGTYSISSNGISAKYTLKPMYEPDGSTCYARWASHVCGNVYFHAVAVSAQSHTALSASAYNKLGSPASAGCIRMTVADAKWIYDYASVGTIVKIEKGNSSAPGPLGKPAGIWIAASIHYDPTDPEISDATKQSDYAAGRISGYMKKDGTKVGY